MSDQLLTIYPSNLEFPFEINKQSYCSLYLTNDTDNYVAFKVKITNVKKYCVRPNDGVALPRSTFEVLVTMQAQKEAPADMDCKDKFLIQCAVARRGAKEITSDMFSKEAKHRIEEIKLGVTYVDPRQPPSPVSEGSEEGSSPGASGSCYQLLTIDPLNLHFAFEENKQISSSLYLNNKTDTNVAFKVKTTNPKKYCVRPNEGVVLPRSSSEVSVTMQAQKEAPTSMECRDKFLFQCIVARRGTTAKDVTSEMFKESQHRVQEIKMGVVYVDPRQPPSTVREVLEEPSSSRRDSFSDNENALDFPIGMLKSLMIPFISSLAVSSSDNDGIIPPPQYQVFINFRGDDLRYSFVGFLAKAMRLAKINVFTDEIELRGTSLQNLFKRIEESRVALAIFSERYTESSWCLDELAKMKEQMEKGKLVVIPVFYRLDATKCKRLAGNFGDNFRSLEREYRSEPVRIQRWNKALSSVFNNIGLTSDIRSDESKFVDLIVEEVKRVLIKIFTEEREF